MNSQPDPAPAVAPHGAAEDSPAAAGLAQPLPAALRLFASVFQREVDRRLLARIEGSAPELCGVLGGDVLAGLDLRDPDAAIEALAVEYCRIFIGPRGHVPPVESVVLGQQRYWGPSTEAVADFYRRRGIQPCRDQRMVPDHIAMELDCLAVLAEDGLREEAQTFAREHPLRWVPILLQGVTSRATLSFYPMWTRGLLSILQELYAS